MASKKMAGFSLAVLFVLVWVSASAAALTPKEELGKALYFDEFLSLNANQSCASCHDPAAGFADLRNLNDPVNNVVSLGSDVTLNGGRNAPSAAYMAFSPYFMWDYAQELYIGGQFWDGRAPTLKHQAMGPFLNPVEMAVESEADVLRYLIFHPVACQNPNYPIYKRLFKQVFGVNITKVNYKNEVLVHAVYEMLADAIAAYEKSYEVSPFTSRFDAYLAGNYVMTPDEDEGFTLFNGKGQCALCHLSNEQLAPDGATWMPPLFTDFTYDNLGIPKSLNPLIVENPVDYGLGARADIAAVDPDGLQKGKFKVTTLRNIEMTAPYGHNGYFATLKDIVHFYNTAADTDLWPEPEVPLNVNRNELGNLGLSDTEENQIVAFMMMLTDGYLPAPTAQPYPVPVRP